MFSPSQATGGTRAGPAEPSAAQPSRRAPAASAPCCCHCVCGGGCAPCMARHCMWHGARPARTGHDHAGSVQLGYRQPKVLVLVLQVRLVRLHDTAGGAGREGEGGVALLVIAGMEKPRPTSQE